MTQPPQASDDSMALIADDFVKAGLAFQQHDPLPYIYLGPTSWKTAAKEDQRPLESVLNRLAQLQSRIDALPPATGIDATRRRDLSDRIVALTTRGNILLGDIPESFDDETQRLFGVTAPQYSEAHFRALAARLDDIIPGNGPLTDRVAAFRDRFVIPPEKLAAVIGKAMQECRSRTLENFELPANEQVTLNLVKDMPWVGFTEYKGDSQSIVHLNEDVPVHIERAIELGCHEGYPGHHVHATLVEQELIKNRGWHEYMYIPMVGPLAVIAEGAASYAMNIAFSREERMAFERDVLLPMAGLKADNLDTYYHFIDLIEQLNFARNEAARKYLYEGQSRAEVERWLVEFGLETAGTAATRLNVIDAQRSYTVNYNLGRLLVANYVTAEVALGTDSAWQVFYQILTTPMSPADITLAPVNSDSAH